MPNVRLASPWLGALAVAAALVPAPAHAQLKLVPFVQNLQSPIGMVQDPSDPTIQYVLEKGGGSPTGTGRIKVIQNGVVLPTPFLELQVQTTNECGMLGLAIPKNEPDGRVFVYHCLPQGNGDTAVTRFRRVQGNRLQLDTNTAKRFVFPRSAGDPDGPGGTQEYIHQPAQNHKGGKIDFGDDGYLYVAVGDGGSTPNAAQDVQSLRGKILRLDVNVPDNDPRGYQTPQNPFTGGGGLPELWAIGLRNPWRISFDATSRGGSGALLVADVGEVSREEVNYVPANSGGRNFEWPRREGTLPRDLNAPAGPGPMTPPVFDYDRDYGRSISGGYIYRGTKLPATYRGRYFFADFVLKKIGSLTFTIAGGEATAAVFEDHSAQLNTGAANGGFTSVDIDAEGELYIVAFGGTIYRLEFEGDPDPDPDTDTDGDGMTDRWEQTFGAAFGGNLDPNIDSDGDGVSNFLEFQRGSHPTATASLSRFFAEGANSPDFFDTLIAIANPGDATAAVNLRFLPANGADVGREYSTFLEVPPKKRVTVRPATLAPLVSAAFSTVIETNHEVAAERTMTWPASVHYGSATETAVKAPAQTWYLAEGSTLGEFSLYYLIENPNATATPIRVTYLRPAPLPPIEKLDTVAANSRLTIDVKAADAALFSENVSAKIEVVGGSSNGIIVERAMYLSGGGQLWRAGHAAMGVTTPNTRWFFPEGATGGFFDMYLLLANPGSATANVTLQFLRTGNRPPVVVQMQVDGNSRWTENVENLDPQLASEAISTVVESDVPLVAERAIYWPANVADGWREGSVSHGATETGEAWVVADAELGGTFKTETFILIANSSSYLGRARVQLMTENGTTIAPFDVDLAPDSRTNIPDVSTLVGNSRFSVLIESVTHPNSTTPAPAQIVVERATYSADSANNVWSAGGTTLATKIR